MKGIVFHDVGEVRLATDLPEPEITNDSGDVIVRIHRSGICGSDLHPYHGKEAIKRGTILGHEFVGDIVQVGSQVENFQCGDRVLSPFTTSCGHCFFCKEGLSSRCVDWQLFGFLDPEDDHNPRALQGAQTELIRVLQADSTLLALPESISMSQGILLGDNFTTGFYCAQRAEIHANGLYVVIGCGAVGLSAIVAARFFGAKHILAIDNLSFRQQRAERLGAMVVYPEEAAEKIREMAENLGRPAADSVMEAVGNPSAQALAFELVRAGGIISSVGLNMAPSFTFSPVDTYNKNITYKYQEDVL
ncbi:MAG: alcohol dehydrogenase [Planctomycetaceae bacterium]|nr:alcohol dehydrogenase [Planctomycetaceae bacterium]